MAADKLSDFLPEPRFRIDLTESELDLLVHFASIGLDKVYVRNALGDREVTQEFSPVLRKLEQLLSAVGGS